MRYIACLLFLLAACGGKREPLDVRYLYEDDLECPAGQVLVYGYGNYCVCGSVPRRRVK